MKLTQSFFETDVLELAPALLGKIICRKMPDGEVLRCRITETEAYNGVSDLACHASKGRTLRTEVMYGGGGNIYVYLIYGMYWMLNFVTGPEGSPQAVLIRGLDDLRGSGKVGRLLSVDKSFYGEALQNSLRMWVEDAPELTYFETAPRVGIDYAGDEWKNKPWRFIAQR